MNLTDAQRHALELIRQHPGIRPARFAELMWPDSDGHRRYHKCGPNGVCRGGMMAVTAGGFLGKLRRLGYIRRGVGRYCMTECYLTHEGAMALCL